MSDGRLGSGDGGVEAIFTRQQLRHCAAASLRDVCRAGQMRYTAAEQG